MLISEIMKHLENGGKLVELSTEKGNTKGLMPYRRLTAAMKTAGYQHVNKGGSGINWQYTGTGESPLKQSIFDYDKGSHGKVTTPKQRTSKKRVTHEDEMDNASTTHEGVVENIRAPQATTPKHRQELTDAEMKGLRAMLQEWKSQKETGVSLVIEETKSLHMRVFDEIKSEEKVRKTLSLNKGVGKALDAFAAGHKLNKQDIIELALWDLFRKYN